MFGECWVLVSVTNALTSKREECYAGCDGSEALEGSTFCVEVHALFIGEESTSNWSRSGYRLSKVVN
jgi:hypothetical protein